MNISDEAQNRGRRRVCPVCWNLVHRTVHERIEGHWDSLGKAPCPGAEEPFRITLANPEHAGRAA